MTKAEVDKKLSNLDKDRHWLAKATGYSYDTIRNSLAPKAKELSFAMGAKIERAFLEEERRCNVDTDKTSASIWDLVFFNGKEVARINEGLIAGGYERIEDLYRDAVINFCDDIIEGKQNIAEFTDPEAFEFPFLGAVAAGEPVSAPLDEMVTSTKDYGPGHFVVEVNGQSAEPDFIDGDRWVIRAVETGTPANGKPCIVSDASGSYLKQWNRKESVFESINPKFSNVIPGQEAKLQGYPVEKLS